MARGVISRIHGATLGNANGRQVIYPVVAAAGTGGRASKG